MTHFNMLASTDTWDLLQKKISRNKKKWKTFHEYRDDIAPIITNGYLDLLKNKKNLTDKTPERSVKLAIEFGQFDILKWLIEEMKIPMTTPPIYSKHCSIEMIGYLTNKILMNYDEACLLKHICDDIPNMVIFLHQQGVRTTAQNIRVAIAKKRTKLSIPIIDFLREHYPDTITYEILCFLEDSPYDTEYFEKHNMIDTVVTSDRVVFSSLLYLEDCNVSLIRAVHRKHPIKESFCLGRYIYLVTRDNLPMMKFFWEQGFTCDKFSAQNRKRFISTCVGVFGNGNSTLKWLMKQPIFIQIFKEEITNTKLIRKLRLDMFGYYEVNSSAELNFLLSHNIDCQNLSCEVLIKSHNSIYTILLILEILKNNNALNVVSVKQLLQKLREENIFRVVARYVYHNSDILKIPRTVFLGLMCETEARPGIKDDLFVNDTIFFCNLFHVVVRTGNINMWKNLRWYYYHHFSLHFEKEKYNASILHMFMRSFGYRHDNYDNVFTPRELIEIHKMLYPVVIDLFVISSRRDLIRSVTLELIGYIGLNTPHFDLIEFYLDYGFVEDTDVILLALEKNAMESINRILKWRPQLIMFIKGYVQRPSSLFEDQIHLSIMAKKLGLELFTPSDIFDDYVDEDEDE